MADTDPEEAGVLVRRRSSTSHPVPPRGRPRRNEGHEPTVSPCVDQPTRARVAAADECRDQDGWIGAPPGSRMTRNADGEHRVIAPPHSRSRMTRNARGEHRVIALPHGDEIHEAGGDARSQPQRERLRDRNPSGSGCATGTPAGAAAPREPQRGREPGARERARGPRPETPRGRSQKRPGPRPSARPAARPGDHQFNPFHTSPASAARSRIAGRAPSIRRQDSGAE